ncbi:MAG: hypothetical protein RRY21_01115 [Oscillospiraceae bacterium]
MSQNQHSRAARRRRAAGPVGAAFLVLAAVGLIAVVMLCVHVVRGWMDQSDKMARYEQFVLPVVMMDPVPFTNVKNIDEALLLQSSLWAALLGDSRDSYTYDENGLLLVPATDVDVAAAKLFGPEVALIHHTFDDYDASYLFDPEISSYRVPLIAKVAYSPRGESITKNGEITTLLVGYIAPGNIWSTDMQSNKKNEPAPDKYMYYDLKKGEAGLSISAVRDIDENAPPKS